MVADSVEGMVAGSTVELPAADSMEERVTAKNSLAVLDNLILPDRP
jgi:hypothetical protein